MKVVNVTQLKAHLSQYLRHAARGMRIVVTDRDEPIAQLGPLDPIAGTWSDRLERDGRLRRGTQRWKDIKFSAVPKRVDVQAALRAVREDPRDP